MFDEQQVVHVHLAPLSCRIPSVGVAVMGNIGKIGVKCGQKRRTVNKLSINKINLIEGPTSWLLK